MGIGLLFPGQASQFPGMGKELHDAYPAARRTFEEASEALSRDVAALCFRGTEEELRRTENTQPAIFTVSVAAFRVIAAETGVRPVCAAGHSLGEYSALVAAGVLPLRDAVRVLRSRGIYMQEAVPVGEGAMAAILGLAPKLVEEACRKGAALGVVSPANYNGGGQIVISGAAKAVAAACEAAMGPAAERLTPELRAIPQGPFAFPVVANVTAAVYGSGDAVAEVLIRQITAPVRWEESVAAMRAAGATSFLEVGPGKVLSGLVRRIDREAPSSAFCAPADLVAVRAFLA